jgi:hypothetical protein
MGTAARGDPGSVETVIQITYLVAAILDARE